MFFFKDNQIIKSNTKTMPTILSQALQSYRANFNIVFIKFNKHTKKLQTLKLYSLLQHQIDHKCKVWYSSSVCVLIIQKQYNRAALHFI